VYISTASVHLPQKGIYAFTKLEGEKAIQTHFPKAIILRPSVIYNSLTEGIVGSLVSSLRSPLPWSISLHSARFYPLHMRDFITLIHSFVTRAPLSGIYDVGGPEALTLQDMQKSIMRSLHLSKRFLIFSPYALLPLITLLSYVGLSPLSRSNILGAAQEIHFTPEETNRLIDLHPRSFAQGIQESIQDSSLRHQEAALLLSYVFPRPTRSAISIREYALFEQACHSAHLSLFAHKKLPSPLLLKGLDFATKLVAPRGILQRKLLIACAIAEITPATASTLIRSPRPFMHLGAYVIAGIQTLIAGGLGIGLLCIPSSLHSYE